ncbi:hypothetical protein EIL87_19740 [Saccharopolyspora rhizosphaerae]|uniref:Uncharacterized protein n=1 Tax=Saccharopolyspora rhizosphaerae TaxID=2492662 RepID=A0A426JMV2_9PSEU|nr:hypothetical protein [Saccharopolyspora rhizosphaerae]RRO14538.1 hypothetical protein EIL87_19740 [Saccharopolyspora rhizosphaerae]
MMSQSQDNNEMGDVVQGPWATSEPARGQVIDAEIVEDSTAVTPRTQAPRPAAPMVRSYRPLTVQQAGGRYAYGRSLVAAGTKRIPSAMADAVLNRVKLAHLREGNHHRGDILPAQRNVYETELRERRERRRKITKAFFVRKAHVTKHGRRGTSVKEAVRPRWETVVPIGAEVANVAYPNTPVLSPLVDGANGAVGGFFDALLGNVSTAVTEFASGTPGALTLAGGLAGLVAWQATREHQDRQSKLVELMSADGNADLMPDVPADHLTAAFRAANIIKSGTANATGQHVELIGAGIVPGDGCWTATLRLPKGVTSGKARARHAELAGALDSDTHRVLLLDGDTDRELTLRVYERLPLSGDGAEYPLATAATFDIFDGVPFGRDLFDREVRVDLTSSHGFGAGRTRNGKTFSERVKIAAAVLDPHVTISLADFKPGGDWSAVQRVARHFIEADDDRFDEALVATRDMLLDAQGEISRRAGLLRGPEGQRHGAAGQINHSMARDLQLSCGPWVIVIDEVQRATGDPQAGDRDKDSIYLEILNLIDDISRRGAAVGVLLSLATQKPDGNILKGSTWDQLGNRFCLHVSKTKISDVVLGDGAADGGADASTLIDRKQRGAGYLAGATTHDDRYVLAKSYNVSKALFAELCERGRRARIELGTLPKAASDEADQQPGPVLQVVDGEQDGTEMPEISDTTRQVLAAAAEVYAGDDAEWITANALYVEVVEGELGLTADQATRTEVGRQLTAAGVERTRKDLGDGKVTVFRRSDLVKIGGGLTAAA